MNSAILTPTQIGNIKVRNRVFLPGHTTNFGRDNLPTERNANYLAERAKGGVGLIFTEAIRVHPTSAGRTISMGAFDDSCIPAYAKLTERVHEFNTPIFAQIMHAGRQANGDATHTAAWSASPIPWTKGGQVPHVMSKSDIKFMVNAFGVAAIRMQKANFDGLEIHLGHGHLIQQFMSPASNTRTDEYGGSLINRLRFGMEVLEKIRQSVPQMNLGIRISANEFLAGGLDPADMVEIVDMLHQQFKFDFIHTSHSAYHGSWSLPSQFADMNFDHAPYREHAGIFKQAFPELPVLAVCRLDTISEAAELIDNQEADLVGLARPHIADPNLVTKYEQGKEQTNTSCIACNQECIGRVEKNLPISCVVNPNVGKEVFWRSITTEKISAKKVLVIGGGPAGMKAALSAAKRGHRVTLLEASDQLGGQINYISQLKKRQRFGLLVQDLIRDLKQAEVEIKLNHFVTDLASESAGYDQVIIATGATHQARELGAGKPAITAIAAIDNYAGKSGTGNMVIIDEEGTWIAGGIAEELAQLGYQVHLVSPTASLFSQITLYSKLALIPRLRDLGVQIHLSAKVETTATELRIVNLLNDQLVSLSDWVEVIDCGPRKANDLLYQAIEATANRSVQLIGDALSPRTAAEAVFEGNAVGAFLDLDLALAKLEMS
ncbi:MAG: hypothetical protein RIT32_809 [Actinomycetota bacterium]|jgi:2,4-dienoyl-CoA reductase-like NADH-dependent reductase (Old Yellow Enzyme family)/thioredoxin reductase